MMALKIQEKIKELKVTKTAHDILQRNLHIERTSKKKKYTKVRHSTLDISLELVRPLNARFWVIVIPVNNFVFIDKFDIILKYSNLLSLHLCHWCMTTRTCVKRLAIYF